MGCMYAVTWNNKNYKDYSTAYKDIMYDAAKNLENPDAWSKSWQDLTSMAPEDAINNSNFKDQLKRQKDYFRRYRDLLCMSRILYRDMNITGLLRIFSFILDLITCLTI